eukprot:8711322-Pyramimonas_sp.AAC.1
MAQVACVTAAHFGTPLTRFAAAAQGVPPKGSIGTFHASPPPMPPCPSHTVRGPIASSTDGSSGA